MSNFFANLLYSVRQLRKTPVFAAIAILTLALGIGANTAVFSVMDAVLLRSLPGTDPHGLFYVHMANGENQPDGAGNTGDSNTSFSMPVFSALRARTDVIASLIAYAPLAFSKTAVQVNGSPLQAEGEEVSGNFFEGLTAQVPLGRALTPDDERSHAPVMVVSYAFWTREFARRPSILGSTISVKGLPFTVVGVTARGFFGVEPGSSSDFWVPLQNRPELNAWGMTSADETLYGTPRWWCLRMMARLRPGVTPAAAQAALAGTFFSAAQSGVGTIHGQWKPLLAFDPAQGIQGYSQQYGEQVKVLMGLVLLVLLIAVTNVALMIAARNDARAREFGVRLALGASRVQLFSQLLAESALLVFSGASLGWLFAVEATAVLARLAQIETSLSPNRSVLWFTLGISALAAVVFGLAPLRRAASAPVAGIAGTTGKQNMESRSRKAAGNAVMTAQVAVCLLLLVAGSLLLRTLSQYRREPLGMQADKVLLFGLSPHGVTDPAQVNSFHRALIARLRALPGVSNAAILENRPGSGWSDNSGFAIDGVVQRGVLLRSNAVGASYFATAGTPILEGRDIGEQDGLETMPVALVNQMLARRCFSHGGALGHQLGSGKNLRTIVGVVADSRYTSVDEPLQPMAYYPASQVGLVNVQVAVRTSGDPMALLPSVRQAVHALAPDLPLEDPMTQSAQFALGYAQPTMFATLGGFFGGLAALLVAIGLYGTLSYRVGRRVGEIGLRMALGAQRGQVVWLVLQESLLVTALGLAIGIPLALFNTRLLSSMLWQLSPTDPASVTLGIVGVLLVVAFASLVPARRAASVDPADALRSE